ncbi:peptidylprolyl isomerase [Hahella sp. SMD15-11]|uniref:Peptidyl-prolyl cis-trans isomerase n=1 Tax=Thermohahella caldifontis TaxID=3142973 RepID=A0AB39UZJ2_9GAMM
MKPRLIRWLVGTLLTCLMAIPALALEAEFRTNQGIFTIKLLPDKAPQTVSNFVRYARESFYDGTIFHRIIRDFMIQGGGYDQRIRKKPTYPPVPNESDNGLSNLRGTVAMARTRDPDSATSQFYINVVDNPHLDGQPQRPGYTVFGRVVAGMDVVDRIANLPTRAWGQFRNLPVDPVVIEQVILKDD